MRVSILSDPNGCNTTAAAAVICVQKELELANKTVTILAGTGPVGQRIAQIIAGPATKDSQVAAIRVCSRKLEKAQQVCQQIAAKVGENASNILIPTQTGTNDKALAAVEGCDILFAAGAAGIELLSAQWKDNAQKPKVAVDLNAVPPAGIAGVEVMDSAAERDGTICYGAIGVGGLKMKIHKRAIQMLFESNDLVLEATEIYELGR